MNKKTIPILLLVLLLISSFNVIGLNITKKEINSKNFSNIIYVDDNGGADYTSIQNAIDAANPGDTVFVYNGTYCETLFVNKSIKLMGEDKYSTIIDAESDNSDNKTLINILAENVNISEFTITNTSCAFADIAPVGIRLSNYSKIYNNILSKHIEAIKLWPANNCEIYNNTFPEEDSIHGIRLYNSSKNKIYNNTFNTLSGLDFHKSYDNLVFDNNFVDNIHGLRLNEATTNTIYKNYFLNNSVGIYLESESKNNKIYNNMIVNCTNGTIIQDSSNDNTIYHNNFINNLENADDKCTNNWYNPQLKRGNYWYDYQGDDKNKDGIGDTPYNIEGGDNQDKYPLMMEYQFPITIALKRFGIEGIKVILKNVDDSAVSNLRCYISIKGGFFNKINVSTEYHIQCLDPHESKYIDSWDIYNRIVRKFGSINISINVSLDGASFTKYAEGFVLGRFIIVKN